MSIIDIGNSSVISSTQSDEDLSIAETEDADRFTPILYPLTPGASGLTSKAFALTKDASDHLFVALEIIGISPIQTIEQKLAEGELSEALEIMRSFGPTDKETKLTLLNMLYENAPKLKNGHQIGIALEILSAHQINTIDLPIVEVIAEHLEDIMGSAHAATFLERALKYTQLRPVIIKYYLSSHKELILSALRELNFLIGFGPCILAESENFQPATYFKNLTYALAQDAYLQDRTDWAKEGCCLGIAMHWLDRCTVGKKSFNTSKKSSEIQEAEGMWDPRMAKKFRKFYQLQLLHNEKAMNATVLYDRKNSSKLPSATAFTNLAPKNRAQGFVIMIEPPQGKTGHAMGMTTDYRDPENPVVAFMDSAVGEFQFSLKTEQPAWAQFTNDLFGGYASFWGGFKSIEAVEFETMLAASKAR